MTIYARESRITAICKVLTNFEIKMQYRGLIDWLALFIEIWSQLWKHEEKYDRECFAVVWLTPYYDSFLLHIIMTLRRRTSHRYQKKQVESREPFSSYEISKYVKVE